MKKTIQLITFLIPVAFSALAQNNLPLPQLPWAQTLTGSEVYPVYQNGKYCKASVAQTDSLASSFLITGISQALPAGADSSVIYQQGKLVYDTTSRASVHYTDSLINALRTIPVTDSIHLSSAQILLLDSMPVTLEPGVAGHNYQVLAIRMDYSFDSTAYTTSGQIFITQDNSTTGQLFYDPGVIRFTESGSTFLGRAEALNKPNVIRGDALTAYSTSPIAGGYGSVDFIITYLIR